MESFFGLDAHPHTYSLATTGLKRDLFRQFGSRQQANEYMYKVCGKLGLSIVEIYDDKHDKTYKCANGVRFFIQRS